MERILNYEDDEEDDKDVASTSASSKDSTTKTQQTSSPPPQIKPTSPKKKKKRKLKEEILDVSKMDKLNRVLTSQEEFGSQFRYSVLHFLWKQIHGCGYR